ncbi:YeiH family protein [Microbulbifer hainanensis]|uniref:YeiH family protein n=1 Tax=Microbulbifer hainanensis TaxID=2735675 RepID=UPI00186901EC|nr:YeiH family protein [Microbulbifer hainanensis]
MWIRLLIIAGGAMALAQLPQLAGVGLSALPLAILLGLLYGNSSRWPHTAAAHKPLQWCQRYGLRAGIVLFGFNLSFQQIAALGWQVLAIDLLMVTAVLALGIFVGERLLGMSRELAVLTSVGSAVCGAAAILATEPVTRARQQDVAVAVATVVLFGTLAMFSYPLIYGLTELQPGSFGVYIGSTVHEVAQAVAAGQSIGEETMRGAVVAKLLRVMLLAPVVLALGALLFRDRGATAEGGKCGITVPWFVFGFIAAAGFNSVVSLPAPLLGDIKLLSQFLLALGMAALGVKTHWDSIRRAGIKPMLLSLLLLALLLGGGLALNLYFYR